MGKPTGKRRIHRVKLGGKGSKHGARACYSGTALSFGSELFEAVVLQADVWTVVRRRYLVVSKQCRFLLMLWHKVFPESPVEVDSLDRPWFRYAKVHWVQGSLKSVAVDSHGLGQHLHFWMQKTCHWLQV